MENQEKRIFLIGIFGGIIGVFLVFAGIICFFVSMEKLHTIQVNCLPEKSVETRNISCEILEVKEMGDILKAAEIVSPPINEEELKRIKDLKTEGKFVKVKVKVLNKRKDSINLSATYFIDGEGRRFTASYQANYWLSEEEKFSGSILPDTEKEFAKIFEISENSALAKLKIKFYRQTRIFD
ncbi:DUF4352 domain-containing protein [Candidatus Parcubacteria bacterium]|nr:DUF4352 domain-containing protein [Candidatus Parcubacteria bacterium]